MNEYDLYTPRGVRLSTFTLKDGSSLSEKLYKRLSSFKKLSVQINIDPTTDRLGRLSYGSTQNLTLNGDHFRNLFSVLEAQDAELYPMITKEACENRRVSIDMSR